MTDSVFFCACLSNYIAFCTCCVLYDDSPYRANPILYFAPHEYGKYHVRARRLRDKRDARGKFEEVIKVWIRIEVADYNMYMLGCKRKLQLMGIYFSKSFERHNHKVCKRRRTSLLGLISRLTCGCCWFFIHASLMHKSDHLNGKFDWNVKKTLVFAIVLEQTWKIL